VTGYAFGAKRTMKSPQTTNRVLQHDPSGKKKEEKLRGEVSKGVKKDTLLEGLCVKVKTNEKKKKGGPGPSQTPMGNNHPQGKEKEVKKGGLKKKKGTPMPSNAMFYLEKR